MSKFQTNGSPVVVIDSKQQKKHSAITALLVAAIVAILAVGGTFAYLTYTSNQVENRLTTASGITADVVESAWDQNVAADANYGQNMVPGDSVEKDPVIINTSVNDDKEFVAMKVTFEAKDADGQYKTIEDADTINAIMSSYAFYATDTTDVKAGWNLGAGWTQVDTDANAAYAETGVYYFYYSTALEHIQNYTDDANIAVASKTTALFDKVELLSTTTQETFAKLPADWHITIKGAAIQSVDNETKTAADFLDTSATPNWKGLLGATAATDAKTGVRAA